MKNTVMTLPPIIIAVLHQVMRIIFGYALAIALGTLTFLIHLWLVSLLLPDSGVWGWLGLGPLVAVVMPAAFLIAALFAAVMSWLPALVAAAFTEAVGARAAWVYALLSLAVALISALLINPDWLNSPSPNMTLIILCYCLAAIWAGLAYWKVAGKHAGLWRNRQ